MFHKNQIVKIKNTIDMEEINNLILKKEESHDYLISNEELRNKIIIIDSRQTEDKISKNHYVINILGTTDWNFKATPTKENISKYYPYGNYELIIGEEHLELNNDTVEFQRHNEIISFDYSIPKYGMEFDDIVKLSEKDLLQKIYREILNYFNSSMGGGEFFTDKDIYQNMKLFQLIKIEQFLRSGKERGMRKLIEETIDLFSNVGTNDDKKFEYYDVYKIKDNPKKLFEYTINSNDIVGHYGDVSLIDKNTISFSIVKSFYNFTFSTTFKMIIRDITKEERKDNRKNSHRNYLEDWITDIVDFDIINNEGYKIPKSMIDTYKKEVVERFKRQLWNDIIDTKSFTKYCL